MVGALSSSEVAGKLSGHFAHEGETAVQYGERVKWLLGQVNGALDELGVMATLRNGGSILFVTGRPAPVMPCIAEAAFEIVPVEELPGWKWL